jgi:hypothetical protein
LVVALQEVLDLEAALGILHKELLRLELTPQLSEPLVLETLGKLVARLLLALLLLLEELLELVALEAVLLEITQEPMVLVVDSTELTAELPSKALVGLVRG